MQNLFFFNSHNFFIFNFVGPRKKVEIFEGLEILSFKMHTKKPQTSNSLQHIHDILYVVTNTVYKSSNVFNVYLKMEE